MVDVVDAIDAEQAETEQQDADHHTALRPSITTSGTNASAAHSGRSSASGKISQMVVRKGLAVPSTEWDREVVAAEQAEREQNAIDRHTALQQSITTSTADATEPVPVAAKPAMHAVVSQAATERNQESKLVKGSIFYIAYRKVHGKWYAGGQLLLCKVTKEGNSKFPNWPTVSFKYQNRSYSLKVNAAEGVSMQDVAGLDLELTQKDKQVQHDAGRSESTSEEAELILQSREKPAGTEYLVKCKLNAFLV
jgi:hypothetical protein